jgi:transposase
MKKPAQHLIAKVPGRRSKAQLTIGIDLGDVWSHYCTLNEDGGVIDRGRFRTTSKALEKWFTDVTPARVAIGSWNKLHLDQRAASGTGP